MACRYFAIIKPILEELRNILHHRNILHISFHNHSTFHSTHINTDKSTNHYKQTSINEWIQPQALKLQVLREPFCLVVSWTSVTGHPSATHFASLHWKQILASNYATIKQYGDPLMDRWYTAVNGYPLKLSRMNP